VVVGTRGFATAARFDDRKKFGTIRRRSGLQDAVNDGFSGEGPGDENHLALPTKDALAGGGGRKDDACLFGSHAFIVRVS
jgi:hypothetical protein